MFIAMLQKLEGNTTDTSENSMRDEIQDVTLHTSIIQIIWNICTSAYSCNYSINQTIMWQKRSE